MKTITIDYERYEKELLQERLRGADIAEKFTADINTIKFGLSSKNNEEALRLLNKLISAITELKPNV